jgi:hypothetical protein
MDPAAIVSQLLKYESAFYQNTNYTWYEFSSFDLFFLAAADSLIWCAQGPVLDVFALRYARACSLASARAYLLSGFHIFAPHLPRA